MSEIENNVKPILKEMGLFEGKDVSVKEAFEKYLTKNPRGIGPLGVFMRITAYKLNLEIQENNLDYMFISSPEDKSLDLLNYDPRKK
jgi:hypothetical protein